MDAIVKSQSSDERKEKSVAPLLQSYLRTEISIKEQQLLLKSRMLAHLPLVPHQSTFSFALFFFYFFGLYWIQSLTQSLTTPWALFFINEYEKVAWMAQTPVQ